MQTNQLNSDKANISSHSNKTSRKGFLRWAGLAAAGALVLTLALACTTPAPETPEKTAVAPTERAEELPAATATTAPAEATSESATEKTPEAEPFEGTLRFVVVNGNDASAARLAALNDQHGFENLFKARVGIESGVSAIAEIDMRDPAGRVMVRLKKDMPEGQTQPSEMAVKDLALSTETEAVIYQNEAEGLVFFWTESLGTAQFALATQEMVGEAVAAPMFDMRRDKTGDANWIKAVVDSDAQGASVYQLTHESDDRGNWVKLANPITVLAGETIFAEAGEAAEAEVARQDLVWQEALADLLKNCDMDHPVYSEVAVNPDGSAGPRLTIVSNRNLHGDRRPTITFSDPENPNVGNEGLATTYVNWWEEIQTKLNAPNQIPSFSAIDAGYLYQFESEKGVVPVNGFGREGQKTPVQEIELSIRDVDEIVVIPAELQEKAPVPVDDRYVLVKLPSGNEVKVANIANINSSGGGLVDTVLYFVNPEGKRTLVYITKLDEYVEQGQTIAPYANVFPRMLGTYPMIFLSEKEVIELGKKSLGGMSFSPGNIYPRLDKATDPYFQQLFSFSKQQNIQYKR